MQRLHQKAKKIAQLAQKLYQLKILEETLNVKMKMPFGFESDLTQISKIKPVETEAPQRSSAYV